MKVSIRMTTDAEEFNVSMWWSKDPSFVIDMVRSQLEAAAVIWPELKKFKIEETRKKKSKA